MMNKRGWLRIFEAVISIMLVTSVVLVLYSKQQKTDISDQIYSLEKKVLDEISYNESLRNSALSGDNTTLTNFAISKVPKIFNTSISVCDLNLESYCRLSLVVDKNIYVSESVLSSNITSYSPKRVRIYVWER